MTKHVCCLPVSPVLTNVPSNVFVVHVKVVDTNLQGLAKIKAPKKRYVPSSTGGQGSSSTVPGEQIPFKLVESYLQEMSEAEQLITRRFLMCSLIYRNAQRQGLVTHLKVIEQSLAKAQETANGTVYVYKVH